MFTTRDRVAQTVSEYDAQGIHRTGADVDANSARWLADCVSALGLQPRLEPFTLDRVVPGDAFIEINGDRIAGIPLFDGTFTDASGILGTLGMLGSNADIAFIEFPPSGHSDALDEAKRNGRHTAVVGIVPSEPPALAIRNAHDFASPSGPPVLQLSSVEHTRLKAAADGGASVRLVAHAVTEPAEAYNVVVEIKGKDPGRPPVVVMTPRSGWFNCAAERGGGIACWLEIMRALRSEPPNRNVMFIATSGHELGHLGLNSFLDGNSELPDQATAWLHLGTSIGAAKAWTPRLQTSDRELEELALGCLKGPEFGSLKTVPTGTVRGGEAEGIHARGGRFVSIVGRHALFHHDTDRWPDAVDVQALAAYADALAELAVRLAA